MLYRVVTHVFDVRAGMNSDHVAVLDTQIVANHSVDAGTAIIELLIGEDDKDSVLALLASYKYCVSAEELEGVHGRFGQSDDAVVIVDGIGNPDILIRIVL
jgi:hypothetical protein